MPYPTNEAYAQLEELGHLHSDAAVQQHQAQKSAEWKRRIAIAEKEHVGQKCITCKAEIEPEILAANHEFEGEHCRNCYLSKDVEVQCLSQESADCKDVVSHRRRTLEKPPGKSVCVPCLSLIEQENKQQ